VSATQSWVAPYSEDDMTARSSVVYMHLAYVVHAAIIACGATQDRGSHSGVCLDRSLWHILLAVWRRCTVGSKSR
jgi:hypothetical protein